MLIFSFYARTLGLCIEVFISKNEKEYALSIFTTTFSLSNMFQNRWKNSKFYNINKNIKIKPNNWEKYVIDLEIKVKNL